MKRNLTNFLKLSKSTPKQKKIAWDFLNSLIFSKEDKKRALELTNKYEVNIYEILSYALYYNDGTKDNQYMIVPFANIKTQESWDTYNIGISANFIDRTHVEIVGLPEKDNSLGHCYCHEYISAYIPEIDKEVECTTGKSMNMIPYLQGNTIVWEYVENNGPLSGYDFTFTFK